MRDMVSPKSGHLACVLTPLLLSSGPATGDPCDQPYRAPPPVATFTVTADEAREALRVHARRVRSRLATELQGTLPAGASFDCRLRLGLREDGCVQSVMLDACDATAAVRAAIEQAAEAASPLPMPSPSDQLVMSRALGAGGSTASRSDSGVVTLGRPSSAVTSNLFRQVNTRLRVKDFDPAAAR